MSAPFAAAEPWAFTQTHPLDTDQFAKQAEARGLRINDGVLAELWRIGALAPLVEIVDDPVLPPAVPTIPEPTNVASYTSEVWRARNEGRLTDPTVTGYRPDVEFHRPGVSRTEWWNGFLYSRWQLITLRWLHPMFAAHAIPDRHGNTKPLRDLVDWEQAFARDARRRTELLVALEARYLPEIRAPRMHLVGATWEKWDNYRAGFDPRDVLSRFGATPDELGHLAARLLAAASSIEPVAGEWSQLIRRAAPRSWDDLSGDMLCALDARIAAEVLLRCYDGLAGAGHAPPLDLDPGWAYSDRERLSHTAVSLDRALGALGLSPHPGVVLVVEGETEELVVPEVMDRLRFDDDKAAVRTSVMRGTHNGLTKLVAFVASPIIEGPLGDHWQLQRAPSRVLVAVDPDTPFEDPEAVEAQRQLMVDEIVATVRAQGVEPFREDLDSLVEVVTWDEACFEFEHFTDEELAAALIAIHPDCNGMDRATLVRVLRIHRNDRHDIKHVWGDAWHPTPSKLDLARHLRPRLLELVDAANDDPSLPVPPVAGVVADAFNLAAAQPEAGTWSLRGTRYP